MEINDFDKIVKEQMSKMEVAPSTGIKKALAFKMFFNNLLLFHKVKLVAALFLMSGGVYIGMNYTGNVTASASEENIAEFKETINTENSIDQNDNSAKQSVDDKNVAYSESQQGVIKGQSQVSSNDVVKGDELKNNISSNTSSGNYKNETTNSLATNSVKSNSGVEKQSSSSNNEFVNMENKSKQENQTLELPVANNDKMIGENKNADSNSSVLKDEKESLKSNPLQQDKSAQDEITMIEKIAIIPGGITTEIDLNNALPSPVVIKPMDDYANNPKKRGLTIDGYYSTFNKVDIDNELDADLAKYHWDFYKEHDYVKTGSRGGININYNWNNFKIGSGIQLSTLRDYKSVYKYFYMPELFANFGIPPVSSAVVYGEDTTMVFYVDPLNEDLKKEVENEYNTYTYLKVPLTLGYELDLKYFSLELNAGVEYGHLINASGVEVKYGTVINDPVQIYFYDDKYMGMMSRKSENLNKHQFAILANATLRVRLTPSFDLYSSINYTQSKSGIYNDNYFLQKTYKNYGAKIGVTYYLNKRLKLKETISSSFE